MNIDKYLYEIIEDYKEANSESEKAKIFNDFCQSLWSSKNKRRVYTKSIKFKVRDDLLKTDIGQIFNAWSVVEYKGYKSRTNEEDWCSLIRQKINNLYTRYCDRNVILNKDYMDLLKTPKNLYFRWIKGFDIDFDNLTCDIDNAISKANELKSVYQEQKMKLSWEDYKAEIEKFLRKAFDNCILIDEYEKKNGVPSNYYLYEFATDDNFYIRYICKSLDGEMLKYQKRHYKVKDHKKYKRCKECGALFELRTYNQQRCKDCQKKYNRKNKTEKQRKYRVEKLKS
ncbi:MAG: hypothetical protein ACI4VL_02260 [Bacilli bacterium]